MTKKNEYADGRGRERQRPGRPETAPASPNADADGLIEGRNSVIEALRAGRTIDKLYIAAGDTDATLGFIAAKAQGAGIIVSRADRRKLDSMSVTGAHQGVIAQAAVREYSTVEQILKLAEARGEKPLLVVCDEITDPHNLGAIIRTAEAAGAHGIVIPKRRSAGLTAVTAKASAGALEHMLVARVPNISAALKDLKKHGLWVYGAAAEAEMGLYDADLKDAGVIVIGSEGGGMGRLVREACDHLVRIPMNGNIQSLNASVAAAVLLYETVRQKSGFRVHGQSE